MDFVSEKGTRAAPQTAPRAGCGGDSGRSVRHRLSRLGARPVPPSLPTLLAFEAVARRRSFTKAALELNLTQTAVSHQIRKLEELLGVQLFLRDPTGIQLTDEGREYLPSVRASLDILSAATQRVTMSATEGSLSIVCLAAFALKCLLPLLPDFRRRHPDIMLRLDTVVSFEAAATYNFDVAIRYGNGDWPGLQSWKIAREELFPVCSPSLLKRGTIRCPEDLAALTIIRTSSIVFRDDWPEWLQLVQCKNLGFSDVISCDTMLAAVQASIDGLGVVMGRTPLVDRDLYDERLVDLFGRRLGSESGYFITSSPDRANRAATRLFIDWLLECFNGGRSQHAS